MLEFSVALSRYGFTILFGIAGSLVILLFRLKRTTFWSWLYFVLLWSAIIYSALSFMLFAVFTGGCLCDDWRLWEGHQHPSNLDDGLDKGAIAVKSLASIENFLKISDRFYCGSEPGGANAFAELAALGIKTVVSVDGARPNISEARKHGLRYIHIPIGYDGVEEEAGLSLARLAREVDGPFFIHCHHGRHRGPAAAAVACLAAGDLDHQAAVDILERAGTSKDYAGLWRWVKTYRPPEESTELPELVEVADIASLAAAMAHIDRAYDNLKLCRDSGWKTPSNHPDLIPFQQALLLKEGFRESHRNLSDGFDDSFVKWIIEAENISQSIENALIVNDLEIAAESFKNLTLSCVRCHELYRD